MDLYEIFTFWDSFVKLKHVTLDVSEDYEN
jgi:hypothetical protein